MARWCLSLALALTMAAAPVLAHHAISAIYDSGKRVSIEGAVREFQFVNPHPWLGVDMAEDGAVRRWRLELDNRWELMDVGMSAGTFKAGDVITARGSAGRDGARSVYVLRLDRAADGLHYEQVGPSPSLRFNPR